MCRLTGFLILVLLCKCDWSVCSMIHALSVAFCSVCLSHPSAALFSPMYASPSFHLFLPFLLFLSFCSLVCRFPDRRGRPAPPSRSHGRVSNRSIWGAWRRAEEVIICTDNYDWTDLWTISITFGYILHWGVCVCLGFPALLYWPQVRYIWTWTQHEHAPFKACV